MVVKLESKRALMDKNTAYRYLKQGGSWSVMRRWPIMVNKKRGKAMGQWPEGCRVRCIT